MDVNVNPSEPPLPVKAEYDHANFAMAFLRGQPHKAPIRINEMRS